MPAGSIVIDILAKTGSLETDIDRASKSVAKAGKAIDKQVDALRRQAAVYGESARFAKLYELALDGATAAQLKAANASLVHIERQDQIAAGYAKIKVAALAAGIAVIAGAAAFISLVKGAGEFADLADRTGASAEGLASLAVAASVAGVGMDTVGKAITKLAKNLTGVDEESNGAGAAIKGLGLNIADLKKLDQVGQLEAVSKAFNKFQDGAEKAAYAEAVFGKQGGELLALFKELENGPTKILTQEQIDRADEYSDKQARAAATLKLYAQAAATEALPAVTAFTAGLTEVAKALLNVDATTGKVGANTGIRDFAEAAAVGFAKVIDFASTTVKAIVFLGETIRELINEAVTFAKITSALNPAQMAFKFSKLENPFDDVKAALAERNKDFAAYQGRLKSFLDTNTTQFQDAVKKQIVVQRDGSKAAAAVDQKPKLQALQNRTATTAVDDPTKKLLDNTLKDLERQAKDEQDIAQSRNKFLDLYNSQNLISISDYYAARKAISDDALTNQVAIYDKEIAALQAFRAATAKQTDKAEAQGKIDALQDKRNDAIQKAGEVGLELSIRQQQAAEDLKKSYAGVTAQVLELQQRLGEAAAIKFDQSNDALTKRFTAEGNAQAIQALQTLRAYTIAQADFTKAANDSTQVTEQLKLQEDRIGISAQIGAVGQLDALKQVGEARQKAVAQMESIVAAEEAIARASGNPALILNAEKARVALDQLKAAADPLKDKFDSIFKDGFSDAISSFLDGTKSAKNAFKDFADSVAKQIIKLTSQDLVSSLYGSRQQGTGLVGLVGSLFGGQSTTGKDQASQAATTSSTSKIASLFGINTPAGTGIETAGQTTATVSATAALDALTAAATAAAGALGGTAGSGAAGGLGGLFQGVGFGESSGGTLGSITTGSANAGAATSGFGFGTGGAGSIDLSGFSAALGKSTEAASSQAASLLGSSLASDAQASAVTAGADASASLASTITSSLLGAISTAASALLSFAASSTASNAGQYASLVGDVAAYAKGTDYVPKTGLAMLHEGEAVIPKNYNPAAGGNAAALQGRDAAAANQRPMVVQQHFIVQGTPNKQTQTQIAASAAQGLRSGQRNL